jgi:hypothetical protein
MRHFLFLLVWLPIMSVAQTIQIPSSRATTLSTIVGIDSIISSTKSQVEASTKRSVDQIVDDTFKAFPLLSQSQKTLFQEAANTWVQKTLDSWTAEEIKAIYITEISSALGPEDLEQALRFYQSMTGKRIYVALRNAESKALTRMISAQEDAMKRETQVFLEKIKAAASAKSPN